MEPIGLGAGEGGGGYPGTVAKHQVGINVCIQQPGVGQPVGSCGARRWAPFSFNYSERGSKTKVPGYWIDPLRDF